MVRDTGGVKGLDLNVLWCESMGAVNELDLIVLCESMGE